MSFLKDLIKKKPVLLIFAGLLFIFIAFVDIKEGFIFNIKPELTAPSWILLSIAIVVLLLGLILAVIENDDIRLKSKSYTFKKINDDKYEITLHQGIDHTINILYGNINDFQNYNKNTIVVLPANDKFDDECVDDKKSVLGSFSSRLYPAGNAEFKESIRKELAKRETDSFDIGSWIYLHEQKAENSVFNVGIVAVTHLREDDTILAYSENIMLAFKGVHKMMTQKRIKNVYIPLIGSGHGGLTPELSLLCLLISIIEGFKKENGHTLKSVNVVVYKNENGDRDIVPKKMKRITKYILENGVI